MNRLGTYPTGPGFTWSFRNKLSRRRRLPIWTLLWLTHHEKGQQKSLKLQSSKSLLELFKFTKVMSFLEVRRKLRFFEAVEVLKNKKHFIILSFCYSHRNSNNISTPQNMYTMTMETIFWFLRLRWEITFTIKIYKFDDLLLWPSIPECSLFCIALCRNQYLEFSFQNCNPDVTFLCRIHPKGRHVKDMVYNEWFRWLWTYPWGGGCRTAHHHAGLLSYVL